MSTAEYTRAWRARNPDKVAEYNRRKRAPYLYDADGNRIYVHPLDNARQRAARVYGYAPPPLEKDLPPRPADGCCQRCGTFRGVLRLHLDHDHITGEFRAWVCPRCNNKANEPKN